ncbi:MAG: DEAD/DEAH box helicase [Candidatus Omnitrophota bacterium]|nr:DEAD/DEAH box helicase [Candidatus Omnitrophota bacterium]
MIKHNGSNQQNAPLEPEQGFFGLGIAPKILEILERIKFKTPTPIQRKAIPLAIEGKDVIGIAQTGTGKTHAFAIPIIQQLAKKDGLAIVLAPTRELALQIEEAIRPLAQAFGMRTACLIGGTPMRPQEEALRRRPHIIIATPGRFIDHMENRNIMLIRAGMLVLDEADRMLDMGFAPQVERILKGLTRERQTMLFSATMPAAIMRMINTYMKLPVHVEIAPSGTTAEGITQELYIVKREAKLSLLRKILAQHNGSVLLFSRTKHNAKKIARSIREMGHRATEIHSNKSMSQRREALDGFKSGRYRILVATDIASRGIDVTKIEIVINYDLPEDVENYVHRIGRTGRAGCKGHAISFATPDQSSDVKNIEKLIKKQLPIAKHPEIPSEEFDKNQRPPVSAAHHRGAGFGHRYRPRPGHFSRR